MTPPPRRESPKKGWHSYAILLLSIACGSTPAPDRTKELAACQLISKSGDELARCLIMKYSWGADNAAPAKSAWQWQLDSIRLDHERQAAVVFAEEQRRRDSTMVVHTRALRRCVFRFVEAYHRGSADTAIARGNESYLNATVRVCASRFPGARLETVLTPEFADSLVVAGVKARSP